MRGKQKKSAYVPEALDYFARSIERARGKTGNRKIGEPKCELDIEALKEALQTLPKTDRESVEKFWGLTGGLNHSKKIISLASKNLAFIAMRDAAVRALTKFLTLDNIIMYDPSVRNQVASIVKKVNKSGLEISDTECVKYIMAFFIYIDNGPKMSFEEDAMSISEDLNENDMFDEYEVLKQMCEEISTYPDKSINLKLLVHFFEMLDFKDMLTIKKSIGIEIPIEILPEEFKPEDLESIEVVRSASRIRELKERVFPYGAWEVVSALIFGNFADKIDLHDFMQEIDSIRKDWGKVAEFKAGEHTLKTMSEVRNLIIYDIGGLKFTDPYEVMFMYLERNLIAPKL